MRRFDKVHCCSLFLVRMESAVAHTTVIMASFSACANCVCWQRQMKRRLRCLTTDHSDWKDWIVATIPRILRCIELHHTRRSQMDIAETRRPYSLADCLRLRCLLLS
ncbi:hypothetical protein GOP47_0009694 [Adiantum capillus-veneris]|uniref:Secreted protein n=1 Tax=Adiantum capillus-veneris TaxID=13818 RepID=A0A9D4UXY6_ADICA|nr:hypothetical protein GOP47_0009694 [Adiantum capillus-veneris]